MIEGLERQQPVQQRAILLQRDTHVFGGGVSFRHLLLDLGSLIPKRLIDLFHGRCDRAVGVFNRLARTIGTTFENGPEDKGKLRGRRDKGHFAEQNQGLGR